jgi:hypothetical protein
MILHQHENNELSESFLKENGEKFSNQCVMVLRLLYKGIKLTAKQTNDILNIADGGRRLRDLFAFRSDVKKQVRYTNGKKEGVEYFLDIPKQPTKESLQTWFIEYQSEPMPQTYIQKALFDYENQYRDA